MSGIIDCFWLIGDSSTERQTQKVIPDGHTEIIFHFGDPYRINLNGQWQLQSKSLLAGQITKHFFLENTGVSSMVGVKLKPTALTHLFDLNMLDFTDDVRDIADVLGDSWSQLHRHLAELTPVERVDTLQKHFALLCRRWPANACDRALDLIFERNGMVTVTEVAESVGVGERHLQHLFSQWVGLTPKYFARIVRFNYLFKLIDKSKTWSDLAFEAAYYDQAHFIRNFKSFTGESPSAYSFDEKNMANFFLNKKRTAL